jgi:hypothetical protein
MPQKGVKRKAESIITPQDLLSLPPAKIQKQKEFGRRITKRKYLSSKMDSHPEPVGGKATDEPNDSLKVCNKILKELLSKKHSAFAWPFYEPVNVEDPGLEDYRDVIERPMDLGTVKQKLASGQYQTAAEFAADVRLVFTNCYQYNPPHHDVVVMARKLQDVFEQRYKNIHEEPDADVGVEESSRSVTSGKQPETTSSSKADDREDFLEKMLVFQEHIAATLKYVKKLIKKTIAKRSKKTAENEKKKRMTCETSVKEESPVVITDTVVNGLENVALADEVVSLSTKLHHDEDVVLQGGPQEAAAENRSPPPTATTDTNHKPARNGKRIPEPNNQPRSASADSKENNSVPSTIESDQEQEECAETMSYEQKRQLCVDISKLPPVKLVTATYILMSRGYALTATSEGSFEVDFDTLTPSTLKVLESYVASCIKQEPYEKVPRKGGAERLAEKATYLEKRLQYVTGELESVQKRGKSVKSKATDEDDDFRFTDSQSDFSNSSAYCNRSSTSSTRASSSNLSSSSLDSSSSEEF